MPYFDCREGTKVLISQNLEMRNAVIGFITRVWDTGVDAVGFPGGKAVYYSGIWRHDDPRLGGLSGEQLSLRLERGVFRVCDYREEDVRRLEEAVDRLSGIVDQVMRKMQEYGARLELVDRALFGVEEAPAGGEGQEEPSVQRSS